MSSLMLRVSLFSPNGQAFLTSNTPEVILIPISLLWNLQVSIWKKLGLIGLFSMTVFIMVASLVRFVIAKSVATDPSWCFAWGAVEISTGNLLPSAFSLFEPDFILASQTNAEPAQQSSLLALLPSVPSSPQTTPPSASAVTGTKGSAMT